jgi:uncharacterized membrane protein YkoI
MTLRSISVLAIPILLLACAGAESPARGSDASDSTNDSFAAPSTPSAQDQQILLSQLARTSVSLNEAIDSALAANPGSRVLGADLDGDDTEVRYEIELALADGSLVEVHIDAATGGIIATLSEDDADEAGDDSEDEEEDEDEGEDDEDDDVVSDCAGSISAEEALQIAETTASGTGVELEVDAEDCEFEVIVHTADGWVEVDVAADGTVVEVGSDEDDESDEDEDEESDEDESDESDEDEDRESDEDDESDDD